MHLAKHAERDIIGTVEVRTLKDQDDFGEYGRFYRREDIVDEERSIVVGFGHGGSGNLNGSERTKAR